MSKEYEAVFCVVNEGFSDTVMFAARKAGAVGGTIIKGRGTTSTEAEKTFGITIQPDKEIVIILVPVEIKDDVLKEIYVHAGLDKEGHGIAFSLPVEGVVGLSDFKDTPEGKEKEA